MSEPSLDAFLAGAEIDPAIFDLRPDYRAQLIAVAGITPGPSDDVSEALLSKAEASATDSLNAGPVDQLPTVATWRDAYRAFGAKPQRTRNSVEALIRRAPSGLPRINRLTDIYNALSVLHEVPIGGEDLTRYNGSPQLLRATGQEPFDTTANGTEVIEHPDQGEVVWCDTSGVTCRRWNWRQANRTQLRDDTTSALFIIDCLDPVTDESLDRVTSELINELRRLGPDVVVAERRLTSTSGSH